MKNLNATVILAFTLLCGLLTPLASFAQLAEGHTVWAVISRPVAVYQNDILVAQIWVSPHAKDSCTYNEFWYLSLEYIYPNSQGIGQSIETVIVAIPDSPSFKTARKFYHHARDLMPGGKRIVTSVVELEYCGPNNFE